MDTYLGIGVIKSSFELEEILPSLPGGNWNFSEPRPFDPCLEPHLSRYIASPQTVMMRDENGNSQARLVNTSRPYATNMVWAKIGDCLYFLIVVEPKGGSRSLTANSPTGEIKKIGGQTSRETAANETYEETGVMVKPEYVGSAFVWASAQENPEGGIISVFNTYVPENTKYSPPARNPQEPVTAFWLSLGAIRAMVTSGKPLRLEADFLIAVGMAALRLENFVEFLSQEP